MRGHTMVDRAAVMLEEKQANPKITARQIVAKHGWPVKPHTARRYLQEGGARAVALMAGKREYKIDLPAHPAPARERHPLPNHCPPVPLHAAVVDIETTDLKAVGYQGYLLALCILPLEGEVETHAMGFGEPDDRRLLSESVEGMSAYDILIGHNLQAFDLNWLHSRFMRYGLAWPRRWVVFDTYQVAKSLAIASYKGLAMLGDYFDLNGIKTSIYPRAWNNVRSWDEAEFQEAIDDIVYHCQQDVLLNRRVFDALFPYAMSLGNNPFKLSKFGAAAHHNGNGGGHG